jgi:hypothetical protein
MSLLYKGDLKNHYNWRPIPNEDSRISGISDNTLFNRNEGFEVLYIINSFAEKYGIERKETGLQIEKLISEKLPSNLRNQIHVMEWLEKNVEEYIDR